VTAPHPLSIATSHEILMNRPVLLTPNPLEI
jgi:hypothetical protein